jgi:hypothetical protein
LRGFPPHKKTKNNWFMGKIGGAMEVTSNALDLSVLESDFLASF